MGHEREHMRILLSALMASFCVFGAEASERGVSKSEYLDLMESAVSAYSDEHVLKYICKCEREGVHEHGFPRLTSNFGVLLANGRIPEKRKTFRRMMSLCCSAAAKGKMLNEGNEFSVKELAIALVAVERAGIFEKDVIDAWRKDLSAVEAGRCYTVLPPVGANRAYNWCVFGCASEQARIAAGTGGDAGHVEKYVSDQIRWFDANGMYKDPNQPAVYDLVTRLQFMAILHYGYDGPSRARLEELLDRSAEPTLAMLSAVGEIPYGGRSNQFLHNHTFYAAECEWYAARYHARGDAKKAARFRLAARRAVDSLKEWLAVRPMRHIKNFYPRTEGIRNAGIGCETYAYFDKYMVTMGSWAMLALEFADESVDAIVEESASSRLPASFATTPDFHFVFLRAGDYSAQFDYNADKHYDCDGLGRLQREGAPGAIFMSVPCALKPAYKIEAQNEDTLAMVPKGKGALVPDGHGNDTHGAWANWKLGGLSWKCRLSADGLESTLTGEGEVAMKLPAFAFDGEHETEISCIGKTLSVRYRGWICVYETDGTIADTGKICGNRNGRYRMFEARGTGRVRVTVAIWKDGKWLADYGNWAAYRILTNCDERCAFELDYKLPLGGTMTLGVILPRESSFFEETVSFSRDTPLDGVEVGVGLDLNEQREHVGDLLVDEKMGLVSLFEKPHSRSGEEGAMMNAIRIKPGTVAFSIADEPNGAKMLMTKPLKASDANGKPVLSVFAGADWTETGRFRTADEWHSHVRKFMGIPPK